MNTNVLKGKIISKFGNLDAFAKELGWKKDRLSRIINHRQNMTVDDMVAMGQALGLTSTAELVEVFSLPW